MRKFTSLMMLFLAFCLTAGAQNFSPTDGAVYLLQCKKSSSFALYNSESVSSSDETVNILSAWSQFDERSFFTIESATVDEATYFTIRLAAEGLTSYYVYAVSVGDGNSNIGVKAVDASSDIPSDCYWNIAYNTTSAGWNISPKENSSSGWNIRGSNGGNNQIGQWTGYNNTDDNTWYIQTPSDLMDIEVSTTIGYPKGYSDDAKATATAVEESVTSTTAAAFYNAWVNDFVLNTPTSTSGLFKIMNKKLGLYLYQECDDKGITFLNDGGDNTKYYWAVTFDGNEATINSSVGTPMARSNMTYAGYESASTIVSSPLTLAGAPNSSTGESYTKDYFLFTNVHSTNQSYFLLNGGTYDSDTNPYFLTTWGTTDSDNHYTFEPYTLATNEAIYTVSITSNFTSFTPTITYNGDYTGNATVQNGGFYILTTAPTADNFTVTAPDKYQGNVAIDGTTINVTYILTAEAAAELVTDELTTANTLIAIRGVGYPTTDSEAYSTFSSAISTAQAAVDGNTCSEATVLAIQEAISAYKSATTGIQMPEDGKAYVFTNVHPGGGNKYINYDADGLTLEDRGTDDANNLPMSAKFICRVLDDGRYAFVNNAGVYLVWRGSSEGYNDIKGYTDTYTSDWCPLTFVRMTTASNTGSASSNEDFFGMMAFGGRRNSGGTNSYFITNSDGSYNQDGGWTLRYNTSHSTAFLVEEVSYPNNVSLNSASGMNDEELSNEGVKYIGTFSAPFATLLPDGVSAYYVTEVANGYATVAALGDAAVPANTGVLLTSKSDEVLSALMVPATDESVASMGTNLLGNSAGAAITMTGGTEYILTSTRIDDRDVVAFYRATGGTSLSMNKAYLNLTEASANRLTLNFGGATSIEGVEATEAETDKVIYDLSGRSVKNAQKGLYIVNGKKVIVK
ncbi:MAG: hypothetical protein Q4E59_05020 [Bacteroidales bacterium]|nr:hypothetical protein [Bacteroidales bacterium]